VKRWEGLVQNAVNLTARPIITPLVCNGETNRYVAGAFRMLVNNPVGSGAVYIHHLPHSDHFGYDEIQWRVTTAEGVIDFTVAKEQDASNFLPKISISGYADDQFVEGAGKIRNGQMPPLPPLPETTNPGPRVGQALFRFPDRTRVLAFRDDQQVTRCHLSPR
jgi:hypothetical protein